MRSNRAAKSNRIESRRKHRLRRAGLTVAVGIGVTAAGCGGGETDGIAVAPPVRPPPVAAIVVTIEHQHYGALPPITPGARITVVNNDLVRHSVTSKRPGLFDLVVEPGRAVTFTAPTEIGSHPFYCRYHAFMDGWLSVRT
ncbi:cupredoxin domain-containing protein [Nocardia bovistercoris]|uniref:EfeO-type cupredoxin-like domain-containing protein n=1 Tax=Nocardia bovistercoris TaxID=2785916 RepID=A0A931N194_9NOCA|nr:hypothetical protein [Nocardia bovistercoris]MBH0775462.1 hypothetical protein [Nocardia bovistercoris]